MEFCRIGVSERSILVSIVNISNRISFIHDNHVLDIMQRFMQGLFSGQIN